MNVVLSLAAARPHVTAPARCVHCNYEWVAVVPDLAGARDNLECPQCHEQTDAAQHARVHKALGVIDSLREMVQAGTIVGVVAVGVEADDTTRMWATSTGDVSRLRMIGAITHLQHCYLHGEDLDG